MCFCFSIFVFCFFVIYHLCPETQKERENSNFSCGSGAERGRKRIKSPCLTKPPHYSSGFTSGVSMNSGLTRKMRTPATASSTTASAQKKKSTKKGPVKRKINPDGRMSPKIKRGKVDYLAEDPALARINREAREAAAKERLPKTPPPTHLPTSLPP